MGIFDSLKNMTNQTVKNNVSKAVSGAVNNARTSADERDGYSVFA